jgi:hypothetical protein
LRDRDFLGDEATYHSALTADVSLLLANRYDLTSLYLRGRADRIAIHSTLPVTFEWECKTHLSTKYQDLTLELLPLMHHLVKAALGVECLYCCRNPHTGQDCGFWAAEIPAVRDVWIPPRWPQANRELLKTRARRRFPAARLMERTTAGSKDPFVIIAEPTVVALPDWRALIENRLAVMEKAIAN